MNRSQIICISSLTVIFAISNCYSYSFAQSSFDEYKRQVEEKYNNFKNSKQKEFEEYRNKVNQEFAEFMRMRWDMHEAQPPVPAPTIPEPPKPIVANPEDTPEDDILPFEDVINIPDVPEPPTPLLPIPEPYIPNIDINPNLPETPIIQAPSRPTKDGVAFEFYGNTYRIPLKKSLIPSLQTTDENSVADAWQLLSAEVTVDAIQEIINLRDRLYLPDWGYFKLTEKIAGAACPHDHNVAKLLHMFLLTQSGYKVRMGRKNDSLVILMPSKETIYDYSYVAKNDINYYVIDSSKGEGSIYIFDKEFPREQFFSMAINYQPQLSVNPAEARIFSIDYPEKIYLDVAVNKNLIDFYNDYPKSGHWNLYAKASLSNDVQEQLYPELSKKIDGKSNSEAANLLLHFVQKAFEYQTDDVQFGVERSLFPDETFYYPYSDCEDRAILYSVLVRELLGLDVVLVHYPQHIATAVAFDEPITGDYFEIDGRKFTVCDPTYINADIGMAMKQFKSTPAEIIKL